MNITYIGSKSTRPPISRINSSRIHFQDPLQSRSSLRTVETTPERSSHRREEKNKNLLTTPVVEAIVQFEDNYDFAEGGTMLKKCSQSCYYLFQDWYEINIHIDN